jgi:hypothetical protein
MTRKNLNKSARLVYLSLIILLSTACVCSPTKPGGTIDDEDTGQDRTDRADKEPMVPLADAPNDNWYAGVLASATPTKNISETWHMTSDAHPLAHFSLKGKKFTLRRKGISDNWFLIPGESLEWTPEIISLKDHPDWTADPGSDGWRWINIPPVQIKEDGVTHAHNLCIGFPDDETRRDDDVIWIEVVDMDELCEDPSEEHPGHSAAGR